MIATKVFPLLLAAALNPLVERLPTPRGNTPDNCLVSDAAPMVRLGQVDDPTVPLPSVRPAAKSAAATPAASGHLEELRRAIAANDRPAFDAALIRARAAGVATRVYEDVARLWDAQFTSPFFAQDSDPYRVANSYPGYEQAVRRQVFTDASGTKFYPAAESRAFVASHAGVRVPETRTARTPETRSTPTTTKASEPRTRKTGSSGSTATTRSPSTRTPSTRTPSTRSSSKPAASRKATPVSPDPPASPRSAAREPAPVVSTAAPATAAAAPPAAGSSGGASSIDTMGTETALSDEVPVDSTAGDTAATQTTATGTTATATTATDTAATTDPAPATTTSAQPAGRPILIPAILILIGLGVLILLFRTKA